MLLRSKKEHHGLRDRHTNTQVGRTYGSYIYEPQLPTPQPTPALPVTERFMRRIYQKELQQLAAYLRQHNNEATGAAHECRL
jgi:hypothetical protein